VGILHTRTWYLAENKEITDRNIGVPLVRKYMNYRTLPKLYSMSEPHTLPNGIDQERIANVITMT
jgi:hypothetical protein